MTKTEILLAISNAIFFLLIIIQDRKAEKLRKKYIDHAKEQAEYIKNLEHDFKELGKTAVKNYKK